jgi:error-prone DNA polymerase
MAAIELGSKWLVKVLSIISLKDEFVHIPLMVFPQVYKRYEHRFKSPFLIIKGKMSRREGTNEIVVTQAKSFTVLNKVLESKDWR